MFNPFKLTILLAIASWLVPCSSPAEIQPKERVALEKLASTLEQEIAKTHPAAGGSEPGMARRFVGLFRGGLAQNNPAEMESALLGLTRLIESEPLRKQCESLIPQLETARIAQEKKAAEQINTLFETAPGTIQSAKKAADLDPLLADLGRLQSEGLGGISNSAARLQGIQRYAKIWQDYLSCTAYGNGRGAREALRELSNSRGELPDIMPRSEILSRLNAMANPILVREDEPDQGGDPAGTPSSTAASAGAPSEGAPAKGDQGKTNSSKQNAVPEPVAPPPLRLDKANQEVLFDLRRLDQIEGVINALDSIKLKPEFVAYRSSIQGALDSLDPVFRSFQRRQAGLPLDFDALAKEARDPNKNKALPCLVSLRAQLISLELPRYLKLPAEITAKPGEGPQQFLERIAKEAAEKQDFVLVVRVRDALRLLQNGAKPNNEEMALARLFLHAKTSAESGAYSLATVYFEKVLATSSDLIAPALIGKQLDGIREGHPEEFEQGLLLFFLYPESYRYGYPSMPPGWPPGRPFPPGMNGPWRGSPNPFGS